MLRVSRLEALSVLKSKSQQNSFTAATSTGVKPFAGPSRCTISTIDRTARRSYTSTPNPEPQLVFPPRKFNAFPRALLPKEVEVYIQKDYDTIESTCRKIIQQADNSDGTFYIGFRMNRDEAYQHIQCVIFSTYFLSYLPLYSLLIRTSNRNRRAMSHISQELRQFITEYVHTSAETVLSFLKI